MEQDPNIDNAVQAGPAQRNDAPGRVLAAAVSLKLPVFWSTDPDLWFLQVEAQFNTRQPPITADRTKFDHVLAALDTSVCREVASVIRRPPEQGKYVALKDALVKAFGMSQTQKDLCLLYTSPSPRDRG